MIEYIKNAKAYKLQKIGKYLQDVVPVTLPNFRESRSKI